MPTRPTGEPGTAAGDRTGLRVRARTVTGGIGLAAVLLLGLALIGGAGDPPAGPDQPAPEHLGPLTAVQPRLREALLTGDEVVRTTAPAAPAAPPASGTEPPAPGPSPERTGLSELCRALLADPSGLPGLWGATPPREVTSRQTRHRGGAVLHQMLGVFDAAHAPPAYGRLREAATGCHRLPVTLADGTPVTVLLRELAADPPGRQGSRPGLRQGARPESATAPLPTDDGYAVAVTIEGERGTRTGWLALDRIGPVISVLRQLGPVTAPLTAPVAALRERPAEVPAEASAAGNAADLAGTRRTALRKLRPLLEALHDGPGRAG